MTGSIEDLVSTCTGPLLGAALAGGFNRADAEELVQETFVAFLEARSRFEGRSSVRTFLFGILYHKGAELSRRRAREEATEDIEKTFESRFDDRGHWGAGKAPQGPEQAALSQETADIIARCAQGLDLKQRMAFHLKEAAGASSAEVCEALGVSEGNLRVLLFRARIKLRECLERSWRAK